MIPSRKINIVKQVAMRQQGAVLLIALIVLVAMTLAGIGLVRSVDTGNLVAGNMAFKQGLTFAADTGTEAAVVWLDSRQAGALVQANQTAAGYYATSQPNLDITNSLNNEDLDAVDWDNNNCDGLPHKDCIDPSTAINIGGNSVSYIIHRLCTNTGAVDKNSCLVYASNPSPCRGGPSECPPDSRKDAPYYRITSRVLGPKNTLSFVQTVVHY